MQAKLFFTNIYRNNEKFDNRSLVTEKETQFKNRITVCASSRLIRGNFRARRRKTSICYRRIRIRIFCIQRGITTCPSVK